jgi:hypothetical protein
MDSGNTKDNILPFPGIRQRNAVTEMYDGWIRKFIALYTNFNIDGFRPRFAVII